MNYPFEMILKSVQDSEEIAVKFADELKSGDTVALNGELGVGKTFFVKSVCKKWEIDNVTSPSFTIMNEYFGRRKVFHFDFYRIKKIEELYDIGFDEYVNDGNMISFIEWAYLFKEILPGKHFLIELEFTKDRQRRLIIDKYE